MKLKSIFILHHLHELIILLILTPTQVVIILLFHFPLYLPLEYGFDVLIGLTLLVVLEVLESVLFIFRDRVLLVELV